MEQFLKAKANVSALTMSMMAGYPANSKNPTADALNDKRYKQKKGSVLILVIVSLLILTALGFGLLAASYGVRHQALSFKNETAAMLAAEAGYEKAIFWMGQQPDMLTQLQQYGDFSETLSFENSYCDYTVSFYSFVGSRPVYRVKANGHKGVFNRTVDVFVIQAVSGWDMGMCRVPSNPSATTPVNYVTGEIIDMPLSINSYGPPGDSVRDIHISGNPQFLQSVSMSESRYSTGGGLDKYSDIIGVFDNGIYFDQPDNKITDRDTLQAKIDTFRDITKAKYDFTPVANTSVTNAHPAVQLEFFVNNNGVGKVRITNDSTVRGYKRGGGSSNTWDYQINTGGGGTDYEKYYIYGYHYIPENATDTGQRVVRNITNTYVTPSYGDVEGEPGGQIFIDGNVIIGGRKTRHNGDQLVKGKITVVATGNIWIADSVLLDGPHDADGRPSADNTNVLGLIAQGVIKVVDPGRVEDLGGPQTVSDENYERVGRLDNGQSGNSYHCHLPRETIIEAAITVGGGGWGAEDVRRGYNGGRKEDPDLNGQNYIIVRGTITEAIRGVVGSGSDGYNKRYYIDERLLEGILPGDIWLRGKYVSAPSGWHDYRPVY